MEHGQLGELLLGEQVLARVQRRHPHHLVCPEQMLIVMMVMEVLTLPLMPYH